VLYVGRSFVSRLKENKVHCYFATRPEVEGFRDQGFVLPKVESLVCWYVKYFYAAYTTFQPCNTCITHLKLTYEHLGVRLCS